MIDNNDMDRYPVFGEVDEIVYGGLSLTRVTRSFFFAEIFRCIHLCVSFFLDYEQFLVFFRATIERS